MEKKRYQTKYKRKYEYKRRNTWGKLGLVVCATIIPLMLVVAILIMPVYTENIYTASEQMESIGLTIIGIAVSVWIGLNIYNAVSVNDLEEALLRLDKLEVLFMRYCFMSELEKTKYIYEISGYLYDEFEWVKDENINYGILFEIEKNYALCYAAYEKNLWERSREYAQDTILLINSVRNRKDKTNILKKYLDIRLSDMYFYKNISLPRSGDKSMDKKEIDKSIVLYGKILEELENSDIDEEAKKIYKAYILNSQGYSQYMYYKDNDDEKVKEAQDKLEQAVNLNGKGRYHRNLGLIYSYYIRKGYNDRDYLELARGKYQDAIDKDKEDYKAYVNYASNILQKFDTKFGLKGRKKIIPEMSIKPEEEDFVELQKCIKYLEIAKGLSATFEDVYFNFGKAYMYKFLLESKCNEENLKEGLRYAETTQVLSKNNVSCIYIMRNLYECSKDISKARYFNEMLNGRGDSKSIAQLYIDYMKRKKNTRIR